MPKQSDDVQLLQDEVSRVYGEYAGARAAYEAVDSSSPGFLVAKTRFDRAQQALHETRRLWREIGEAAGVRDTMVRVADNSEPEPSLIPVHITGNGQA